MQRFAPLGLISPCRGLITCSLVALLGVTDTVIGSALNSSGKGHCHRTDVHEICNPFSLDFIIRRQGQCSAGQFAAAALS
ncbi:MAG: hypothetical protein LBL93_04130 [Ruminococcus sp.]|nr:hypothetical protein [Ruminococcus sp.]